MRCPFCGHTNSQVKDSRPNDDQTIIRRRRYCPDCGSRFTTFEHVQLRDVIVIKKDLTRTSFDRDKLYSSIAVAVRKRPITQEQVENIVNSIQRKLEVSGEDEVPSVKIGELVMEALYSLDQVAYVRFASVYCDFKNASDFKAFISNLDNAPRKNSFDKDDDNE
ncbi:MAG: transcriptional regulator NrdR [Alphaproteobacteria bacterium]|nr:transcriptional regulator NrdR [Alphaproteobacteria bacterium]